MYIITHFKTVLFVYLFLGLLFPGFAKKPLKAACTEKRSTELYPTAEGASIATDYRLFVNGKEVAVYQTSDGAFASYGAKSVSEITVIYLGKLPINHVDIRPKSRKTTYNKNNKEITFNVGAGPLTTVVEVNEELNKPLFIFTNPIEENKPSSKDAGVHYFKAGKIYQAGELKPKSGETIYIEGGAIVKGNINIFNRKDIRVAGYGILDGRGTGKTVRIEQSSNISWDGPTILNDENWAFIAFTSHKIEINNIKVLSYGRISTDGLDVVGSKDVTISNSFMCAEDDAIAIKTEKFGRSGPVARVAVKDCVIFNKEPGNGLEIGYEINHDVSNISFGDIDIIHSLTNPDKPFKRAAISIHNAGKGTVSNVSYKNIRIEDAREHLFYLGIHSSEFSPANYAPGKIDNVSFENISLTGGKIRTSVIKGYNDQHSISNIRFNNLMINDCCIKTATEGSFSLTYADRVSFNCTAKGM